jgi:hypothetical protein
MRYGAERLQVEGEGEEVSVRLMMSINNRKGGATRSSAPRHGNVKLQYVFRANKKTMEG